MATHPPGIADEAALTARPSEAMARMGTRALLVGGAGLLLSGLGFVTAPGVFWQSYLIAYVFLMGITLGPLAVLMIQHLTGGAWTMISRRVLEAATRNLPLMALLFLPLAFKVSDLYAWAQPIETLDETTAHAVHLKHAYLNVPFFFGGTALLIVVGVALDTVAQMETHLLTRNYEGFMKRGRLRGRRG